MGDYGVDDGAAMCGLGTIERVVQKMKKKGSGCEWRREDGREEKRWTENNLGIFRGSDVVDLLLENWTCGAFVPVEIFSVEVSGD